jgi:hypothetical protein
MERTLQVSQLTQPPAMLQPWFIPDLAWYSRIYALEALAERFEPISLRQMDSVALLDRVDAKFVLTYNQLLGALNGLQADYRMLVIQGLRLHHYRTLYFDTRDFDLFTAHVNGRAERYKVRSREYSDSGLSFIEVKHKTRKDRTVKTRIATDTPVLEMNSEINQWLGDITPLDGSRLEPKIWNTFTRITLVSKQCCERVTLDVDLAFLTADKNILMDPLAIAEVKMDRENQQSPFMQRMRAQRIRKRGFSKYSIGVGMLYDQVKKNALKPSLLMVEKIMKGCAQ